MLNRYKLIITATLVAVYFTSLVYLLPGYRTLWFSLEFIVLPAVFIIGYEKLIEEESRIYKEETIKIIEEVNHLEKLYRKK